MRLTDLVLTSSWRLWLRRVSRKKAVLVRLAIPSCQGFMTAAWIRWHRFCLNRRARISVVSAKHNILQAYFQSLFDLQNDVHRKSDVPTLLPGNWTFIFNWILDDLTSQEIGYATFPQIFPQVKCPIDIMLNAVKRWGGRLVVLAVCQVLIHSTTFFLPNSLRPLLSDYLWSQK